MTVLRAPSREPIHTWSPVEIGAPVGAVILDGTTIASGAVVSGVFTEPGTVLAGCPATVVRRGAVRT